MDNANRYAKAVPFSVIPLLVLPGMQLDPTGTESILVSFLTPNITEGIDHYLAKLQAVDLSDIHCTVSAADELHDCELFGLEPATKYTITAQACLEGDLGCGISVENTSVTEPMGELPKTGLDSFLTVHFSSVCL